MVTKATMKAKGKASPNDQAKSKKNQTKGVKAIAKKGNQSAKQIAIKKGVPKKKVQGMMKKSFY